MFFGRIMTQLSLILGVSKSEVRGLFVFLAISVLMVLVPVVQRAIYSSEKMVVVMSIDKCLNDGHEVVMDVPANIQVNAAGYPKVKLSNAHTSDLVRLGVREIIGQRLINYIKRGGKVEQAGDLQKIYGISGEEIVILKNGLVFDGGRARDVIEKHGNDMVSKRGRQGHFAHKFDLNLSDSAELESVKGIGAILAVRIIKYREKLGGFVNVAQLSEVYGISDFAIAELGRSATIASDYIPKKLKINQASYQELSSHPYLGATKAKLILKRLKKGERVLVGEDLNYVFSASELQRLLPYLSFE